MKTLNIFIIIFVFHLHAVCFFDSSPVFKKMSLEEGLPHANIYELFQDHKGFIWIGTEHGLCRYDGYNFQYYFHNTLEKNSLSGNDISSLAQQGDILWIGTWGGGLNRLDLRTGTIQSYVHSDETDSSISGNRIKKILIRKNLLWIATFNNGINLFNPTDNSFRHFRHDPENSQSINDNRVWDIVEDKHGMFWVGTQKGLCAFNPETETAREIIPDNNTFHTMLKSRIRRLRIDNQGMIWIVTQKGLCLFDPDKETFSLSPLIQQINSLNIIFNDIHFDENGIIWLGSNGSGLMKIDSENGLTQFLPNTADPGSISSRDIRNFLKDRSGNLWIGTRNGGLNIINTNASLINKIVFNPLSENSISSENIRSITTDNTGRIYLGCTNALNVFDTRHKVINHFTEDTLTHNSLPNNAVSAVLKTSDRKIWVGTLGGGLTVFDYDKKSFKKLSDMVSRTENLPDRIISLYESSSRILWIGATTGLYAFNPLTQDIVHYDRESGKTGMSNNVIRAICEDRHGQIWAGTEYGLNILNPENGTIKKMFHIKNTPSINSNVIHCLFRDSKNDIWIGTSAGVNVYNHDSGNIINPTDNIFLSSYMILSVIEDDLNGIWIGSHNGLFHIRKDKDTKHLHRLNENNGLPSASFSENACYKDSSGNLFFGTSNGLIRFNPEDIKRNLYKPDIELTSCNILNKDPVNDYSASFIQSIELTHTNRSFELIFSALDYTHSKKQQYAFKLENYDTHWNYTGGKRTVSYSNLPAGDYTLKVKAANSDGLWNTEGRSFSVRVIPAFWETLQFRVFIIISLLLMITGIVYLRITMVNKQKAALEIKVKEAMENIKILTGFIPICASCKKIRDDQGYWNQVEEYISKHSDAVFSHGICPDCKQDMQDELETYRKEKAQGESD